MSRKISHKLFQEAQKYLVGGVNSPVRAFRGVGGEPIFATQGKGSKFWDVDGNEYIDYVLSWGPLLFGHAHPKIVKAVKEAASKGTSFGIPTEQETTLAKLIQKAFPSMEKIRLVSSGTEATMSAIRAARGYTGRSKIIKFDGCYHGHGDALLVQAGSGAMTLGQPDSAGVPYEFTEHTISVPYNHLGVVERVLAHYDGHIACIIIEPVVGNMGCVPPNDGYLEGLRKLCTDNGVVLIFDEVMTGFRVAFGGAQELYKIKPDMTTLGKVMGGGLPVGAYGGKKEIMEKVAPLGPVYQAGTLSGNPVSVAAGIAMLNLCAEKKTYKILEQRSKQLEEGLRDVAKKAGIAITQNRVGAMFTTFFSSNPVSDYTTAKKSDTKKYGKFFHAMLERGIYLAPSQFEAGFMSTAHSDRDVEKTIQSSYESIKMI